MNKEQILSIMDHVDPALVEGADCVKKKRMPRIARTGLIAACLCVALVGTAFAVETVTGVSILRYFSGEEFEEIMQEVDPNYRAQGEQYAGIVLGNETMGVSLDGISQEALAYAREHEAAGDAADMEFASLEEAEAFLGLDFYDNPAMDALAGEEYSGPELYDGDGNLIQLPRDRGVYLLCCPDNRGMAWVFMTHFVNSGDGELTVVVGMDAVSSRIAAQSGDSITIYADGTQVTEEMFETVWGGEIPVVFLDFPETEPNEARDCFQSYFIASGVQYRVTVECGQDTERGAEVIRRVLNAFDFKKIS